MKMLARTQQLGTIEIVDVISLHVTDCEEHPTMYVRAITTVDSEDAIVYTHVAVDAILVADEAIMAHEIEVV